MKIKGKARTGETATEKILRLLLLYPKRRWKQSELALKARCSKAFLSKIAKRFIDEGILVKPSPQELLLLSESKALSFFSLVRRLPAPVYIQTQHSKEKIENMLKKMSKIYCLTLFSAAWHRIKFMRTNTIEMYVPSTHLGKMIKKFGKRSKTATPFIILKVNSTTFYDLCMGAEKINGLWLTSAIQNYVDLMKKGGTAVRVAGVLAKKYNLIG